MVRTTLLVVSSLAVSSAFMLPASGPSSSAMATRGRTVMMAAGGDEEWRQIVGSEANLRNYLGKNGFRYNLAKTDDEIAQEGDFSLWDKIWGGTSNNAARQAARAAFRKTTMDQYDSKKANEGKEWLAKYGYKRWGLPYLDKSAEGGEAAAPAAAPKAAAPSSSAAPSFSFGFPKPSAPSSPAPKASTTSAAPKASAAGRPKIGGAAAAAAPKAVTPAAAPNKPSAASPRVGPLSATPSTSKVNLNLMKKK